MKCEFRLLKLFHWLNKSGAESNLCSFSYNLKTNLHTGIISQGGFLNKHQEFVIIWIMRSGPPPSVLFYRRGITVNILNEECSICFLYLPFFS
jgi:hypothetical protein